ncbi:hypothetical protein ANO14919_131790 [Xylariales sp. No.14919]|nr:hypothetical protein ANO14919_131790 [Xylariales sp. No.14919]
MTRKKNFADFVQMYKSDPRSLHKKLKRRTHNLLSKCYNKSDDLGSMWMIPFGEIEEESRVLGIITMLGSTIIPSTLFNTKTVGLGRNEYLVEIGRYNAAAALLTDGFDHCKDKDSTVLTNLSTIMGGLLGEGGHDLEALNHKNAVLWIREHQIDAVHSEIANALSNSALSMVGCGKDIKGALTMLRTSLEIDLANPREDHIKVIHLRHLNTAFALRALRRF